jgi:hypothetical protein
MAGREAHCFVKIGIMGKRANRAGPMAISFGTEITGDLASTEADSPLDGVALLAERRAHDRAPLVRWREAQPRLAPLAPAWVEQLVRAADPFIVARAIGPSPGQDPEERPTLLAGYPWFGDWGRDTMISLPGLTLVTGRPAIARRILRTYATFLASGTRRPVSVSTCSTCSTGPTVAPRRRCGPISSFRSP